MLSERSRTDPSEAEARARACFEAVCASLDGDKAQDVTLIDLAGRTSIADHMVIASGTSGRHVAAMAEHLQERLKSTGLGPVRAEGLPQGDWVLIDAGDVIVHLFRPEVRTFYDLEGIWAEDPTARRAPR